MMNNDAIASAIAMLAQTGNVQAVIALTQALAGTTQPTISLPTGVDYSAQGLERIAGSAPAPAAPQTRKKERKPLGEAKDVEIGIIVIPKQPKGRFAFRLKTGEGKQGAKMRLKDAGFTWDGDVDTQGLHKYAGAYVGTTAMAKALGLTAKSTTLSVPADWVQKGRDFAKAKAEKREAKAQARATAWE